MPNLPSGVYHPVSIPESQEALRNMKSRMYSRASVEIQRIMRERTEAENTIYLLRLHREI